MEKYSIITSPVARIDLDDAIAWYESKQEGLGIDFLLEFYDLCNFVQTHPRMNQIVYGIYRRFQMKRFPYLVYYTIDERTSDWRIIIMAIFHSRTGNEKLKQRLGEDV